MDARARTCFIGIAAFMALCAGAPARAQDSTKAEWRIPLKPGVWALEIEMQGTLFGSGYATVAGKKHFHERSAIEAGVTFNLFENQSDGTVTVKSSSPLDSTTAVVPVDSNYENDVVGIFIHYVHYAQVWERVALLWGVGPIAQWRSYHSRNQYTYADGSYNSYVEDSDVWGVGLGALAGFEWFFAGRLSLGGRVGVTGLYEQGDRTQQSTFYDASTPGYSSRFQAEDIDRISGSTSPSTLVLSLYF